MNVRQEEVYFLLMISHRDEEQWVCPCHLPSGGAERDGFHSWIMDTHQGGE